jgi:CRISPR-associated protein Csm2
MDDLQSELVKKGLAKQTKAEPRPRTGDSAKVTNFFYKDEQKKILKEELLSTKALDWAGKFINPSRPEHGQKNPKMTSAQMRRFYGDAKSLEAMVNAKSFEPMKPLVKMMKSKVAYSCASDGRDRKVPIEFRKYIEEMVNNINDEHDFRAFMLCFEAVVGYFYGEGGR